MGEPFPHSTPYYLTILPTDEWIQYTLVVVYASISSRTSENKTIQAFTLKTALHVRTLSISTDIIILGTFIDIDTT